MKTKTLAMWTLVAGAAAVGGCGNAAASGPGLYQRLQSDDHHTRVQAVIEAGRRRDLRATPFLVDRLEDDDVDIRLFSVQALRDITGKNFGYRYFGDEASRRAGVDRWRAWLNTEFPGAAVGRREIAGEHP